MSDPTHRITYTTSNMSWGNALLQHSKFGIYLLNKYRIRSNYRTYPYKHTLVKFRSLQITASVHFIYFFIKAYVVGSHLNCIDLSMQFKWVPTTYAFIKKIRKKSHNHHQISPFLIFLECILNRYIFYHIWVFPVILKNLSAQCGN